MMIGKRSLLALFVVVFGLAAAVAQTQNQTQKPNQLDGATEDFGPPSSFPLAAPAGTDSKAISQPPPNAVNTGPIDPTTWKFGPAFNPPPGAKIWNPVKLKMLQGGKVTGGTLFSATDPATYCAMADAGYDFVWTEMQHDQRDWDQAALMWRTCPHAKAVPGARVAYADEREIQHALDAGALVIVVPTVDTVAEAIEARNWTYFPPLGRRSAGGGQAFDAAMWGSVPGGYRATANDNIVLVDYINADPNFIAIVPVGGVKRVCVSTLAGSGVKYVSGQYEWWSKGSEVTFTDHLAEGDPVMCLEVSETP